VKLTDAISRSAPIGLDELWAFWRPAPARDSSWGVIEEQYQVALLSTGEFGMAAVGEVLELLLFVVSQT